MPPAQVGGHLSRGIHRGLLVTSGESTPYQRTGVVSSLFWSESICKTQKRDKHSTVVGQPDSIVSHINRMGGTKSPIIVDLTRTVWQWCLERKISLVAQHIPGKVNFRADFLLRHLRESGMFMCHFWHNFDGPFYSNNGTYSTLPLMAYIYLPFLAHLCTQLPIGTHVPFQPRMAW